MAGPGGGPPRKSHTKSRKGCRMCKKRHIRCDEHFPQCRNCTKHSVRCDYMDVSKAGEEPAKGSNLPELLTSPQLQQALDNWRLTGEPPLSELRKTDTTYWTRFSTIDLRLIHHITTVSSELYRRGYSPCTPWTPKMSNLISVALSSDYTMNALLAMSAAHLAWQTKNSETEHLAYHHRGIALKGLHEALGTFSEHTSEAVLAASMMLSWQAKDWQGWVSLQQGISTVMSQMRPWMHQSELAKFLDSQRALARIKTPSTPSITGLPPQQPGQEDLQRLERVVTAIHDLRMRLTSFNDLTQHVDDMLEYVDGIQSEYPPQGPNRAFDKLLHLRSIVFWLPTITLRPEESDLGALAMLCHFYALALVLEPLFPEIGGAYLGNMCLEPLEKIFRMVQARSAAVPHDATLQTALSMLDTPIQIAHTYRVSRRTVASSTTAYHYSPQSSTTSYPAQTFAIPSPPEAVRQGSYYSINTYQNSVSSRQDSIASRSHSDPRLSIGSSLQSVASPQHSHSEVPSTNIDYFGGPSSYQPATYGAIGEYSNRQANLPRPIIPSNTNYSTIPPPINVRLPHGDTYEHDENDQQARQNNHGWG